MSWYDRTALHLFSNQKITSEELPERVVLLATIIIENNIQAPQMKYGQDRLKYYLQEYKECEFLDLANEWLQVEDYKKYHPEIATKIKNEFRIFPANERRA
ncbi:hypothetical protein [Chryseobacterium sp.]|uniref:hypothetical protein n=1 Tax=Chryseobacterium sp. TaxID=1871047 RepID=UPI0031DFD7EC